MKLTDMKLIQDFDGVALRLEWDNNRLHQVSLGDGRELAVLRGLHHFLRMLDAEVLEKSQEPPQQSERTLSRDEDAALNRALRSSAKIVSKQSDQEPPQ